jgi:trans-2,3-dihydro-3-hydroxyanthranilate isomerase
MKFYITDVFGNEKYSGNQLATFVNCGDMSGVEMQQIAREINFSETTFITNIEPQNGGYDVRIFTPAAEVDFAGHPTIGTAYIINNKILKNSQQNIKLNLKVGQIEVEVKDDLLNISVDEIDELFPIEEVSTGLEFTIVPLKSMESLKKANINLLKYNAFVKYAWAKGLIVFSKGGYNAEQQIGVRAFISYLGIPEDPATGSGNGCLAAYLVKHKYFNSTSISINTGQGYEINRPSQLSLDAKEENGNIFVKVGGKVISIAEGEWNR